MTAYRAAFARPGAAVGLQHDRIAGVPVWVLPNPSGLNAHYRPADLVAVFSEARRYVAAEVGDIASSPGA